MIRVKIHFYNYNEQLVELVQNMHNNTSVKEHPKQISSSYRG